MSETSDVGAGKHYSIGDVGPGARVVQGDHNTWIESLSSRPGGASVANGLRDLLDRVEADTDLEPDDRELALDKTQSVADALPAVADQPEGLRKALRDAKQFFESKAQWAWDSLRRILASESGRQLLDTVTDVAARVAIMALLGVSAG